MTSPAEPGGTPRPLLRIVKGEPTPEELAALVAVIAARSQVASAPSATPESRWAAPHHRMRRVLRRGPGAWRASALPS
ncbi:MAG: acyl-CoA carboxylase subunit epsilon [Nocardioidaceae bacterium]